IESSLVGERRIIAEELRVSGVVRRDQHLQKQPAEQRRENLHRQKIVRSARDPLRSIRDRPPPGTTMCTCGWCVSAEPHVCSTDMKPMRAPRCRAVAAILRVVSAEALN